MHPGILEVRHCIPAVNLCTGCYVYPEMVVTKCFLCHTQALTLRSCKLEQLPPWLPQLSCLQKVEFSGANLSQRKMRWTSAAPALRSFKGSCVGIMLQVCMLSNSIVQQPHAALRMPCGGGILTGSCVSRAVA